MKKIFILFLILLVTSSCNNGEKRLSEQAELELILETDLLQKFIDKFNYKKVEIMNINKLTSDYSVKTQDGINYGAIAVSGLISDIYIYEGKL